MSEPAPDKRYSRRCHHDPRWRRADVHGAGRAGEHDSVAAAAGVSRAAVYHCFPDRQALFDELALAAVDDADERLASGRMDEVAADEGIARAIRALVDVGDSLMLLARERVRSDAERFERGAPAAAPAVEAVRQRGTSVATSSARLTESLIGLIAGVPMSTPPLGEEDAVATITGLFLDGARARGPRPA